MLQGKAKSEGNMDVILFGGSFNPPHIGHRHVISTIQKKFPNGKLYICPNFVSPFKLNGKIFTKEEIWSLCQTEFKSFLANQSNQIVLWDEEIKKENISFTIDTIQSLKTLEPNKPICLVIGEDNIDKFNEWKSYKEILEGISNLIIVRRKTEFPLPIKCPEYIDKSKFLVLDNPIVVMSSSELRNHLDIENVKDSILPETKSLLISILEKNNKT
ncbi:nicotinate-nicotinamide nucleotide adenylyltransferase [Leptospira sp. WS39.C2]